MEKCWDLSGLRVCSDKLRRHSSTTYPLPLRVTGCILGEGIAIYPDGRGEQTDHEPSLKRSGFLGHFLHFIHKTASNTSIANAITYPGTTNAARGISFAYPSFGYIWVVVKIMVPFWVPLILGAVLW